MTFSRQNPAADFLSWRKDHAVLTIRAVPNAGRTELAGLWNQALKIKLQAQPEDGKANKELISFLSDALDIPKSSISILHGELDRNKVVAIYGIPEVVIRQKLKL